LSKVYTLFETASQIFQFSMDCLISIKRNFVLIAMMGLPIILSAKKSESFITRVDPPNWWIGMAQEHLELTFYGNSIQNFDVMLEGEDTKITKVNRLSNPNYLFVEIDISANQKSGNLIFTFSTKNKKKFQYAYPLLAKEAAQSKKGIDASDLIYLVFPDRFSNGDPSNDVQLNMQETTCDRNGLKKRHGGDLAGIENHLDYLQELGTTAIWINPVLENNQPSESYHGYAATDLYKIDPRFGSNKSFASLVDVCHSRGIKVVWDVVYNHWGNQNWMYKDLPDSNWVHWFDQFTRTSYRAEVLMDPYASEYDKKIMTDAWFDHHMPDLNQQDVHLKNYLIQNSIWWIEYAGLDAFRIDTYAYPDQKFMKELNEAVLKQYPDFFLFGETWVQGAPVQGWFTEKPYLNKSYDSALQGVTDFQLYYAITKGLHEKFGWEEGFRRIEMTLAHDIVYRNPNQLVTFLDNHDLSRFYSMIGEDFSKYKMGISMLYTLRGIPCIYYGTEILMKNYADPDAKVREDFPGGWQNDALNKFTDKGRNEVENQAFNLCSTLGQWRKNNAWLAKSKLTQFVPDENTYVYFRQDDEHTLMCIYNLNETDFDLKLNRFSECLKQPSIAYDILTGQKIQLENSLKLPSKSVMILEIQ
jgi:glycosidase